MLVLGLFQGDMTWRPGTAQVERFISIRHISQDINLVQLSVHGSSYPVTIYPSSGCEFTKGHLKFKYNPVFLFNSLPYTFVSWGD